MHLRDPPQAGQIGDAFVIASYHAAAACAGRLSGVPHRSHGATGAGQPFPVPGARVRGSQSRCHRRCAGQRVAARPGRAARPALGVAAQGRRRHPGHRGEVLGQRGHRHRQPDVPVATSPGRAGFGPSLSLSYDSGAGNGPFGLGWKIGTSGHHPQDRQGHCPATSTTRTPTRSSWPAPRTWSRSAPSGTAAGSRHPYRRTDGGRSYLVQGYRPRVEGLFARIERWRDLDTGETHWRRSRAPTSPPSTARPRPAASPTRRPGARVQLADLRDLRRHRQRRGLRLRRRGQRGGRHGAGPASATAPRGPGRRTATSSGSVTATGSPGGPGIDRRPFGQ